MQKIARNHQHLYLEQVKLEHIATETGTPCFAYSKAAIIDNYQRYAKALGSHPGKICYAVKANSNLAILQVLAQQGAHFDIVSAGEMARVLRAGASADRIIFSGVGKTVHEMQAALAQGIACFNVESEAELEQLSAVAAAEGHTANISLRVNPDVDANTHPYISTGLKENKFGIAIEHAPRLYRRAQQLPGIHIVGVDCHIGSQLLNTAPLIDALEHMLALIQSLSTDGIDIRHLDLGGGLGIAYHDESAPDPEHYIAEVLSVLGQTNLELIFEPGRSIVGNAGVLLTQVLYLKPGDYKNFAIVDAAMNDNIRPALYQAWQDVQPLHQRTDPAPRLWDVVGPVCETGDFLAKQRPLSLAAGDFLAIMSSGAYCFSMSSNYNTRCRAAEVLVDGNHTHLIRQREEIDELFHGEYLLPTDNGR